jgi:FKBP-type peptidyl-prolyl cis-trans isomerase
LKTGSKALVFVPSNKAYGAKGSLPVVPPYADLMLYIEVVAIK